MQQKPAHAVPLASGRQHPENQKVNQAGHSSERTVEGHGRSEEQFSYYYTLGYTAVLFAVAGCVICRIVPATTTPASRSGLLHPSKERPRCRANGLRTHYHPKAKPCVG